MKHILIIGATGQIGSELTMELRRRYGNTNVVAGYIQGAEPKGELKESGPSAVVDVTNGEMIESVVKEYHIDTIYNLAALLSVVAESKPKLAWKIGIDGLWNVLEVARRAGMCGIYPQFYRIVRCKHASYTDTTGYYPASPYYVWSHQGNDRVAE